MEIIRIVKELATKLGFRKQRRQSADRAARAGLRIAMNGCRL